jgi:NitT/TauT family transport system substrate-binding protein
MMSRRGAVMALVAAGALAACATQPSRPAAVHVPVQSAPPLRERVRVLYTSQSTTQVPLWLAQEGGHFLANGLDVELSHVSGSMTATQALLAGEADVISQGGAATVGAALAGADSVLLATTHGSFVFALVANPGVATMDSLQGQALGVTRYGTTADFAARYALLRQGLEPGADVSLVQTGGNAETLAALQAGTIQAAVVGDALGFDLKRRGYPWLLDLGDLGVEYCQNGLASSRGYVAEHPDRARRVVRAVVQGMGQFVREPAVAQQVLARYSQSADADTLEQLWQAHATKHLKRLPYTTPDAMRLVLEEVAPRYERARKAAPEDFYDNRFVHELDESGFIASVYQ